MNDVLEVGGKTLTMYAGVLGKIDEAIGGFDRLDDLATNTDLQFKLVKAVVANYNDKGEFVDYKFNVFNITPKEFNEILQWGVEHYTVFMMTSSTKIVEKLKAMEAKLVEFQKSSKASQNG